MIMVNGVTVVGVGTHLTRAMLPSVATVRAARLRPDIHLQLTGLLKSQTTQYIWIQCVFANVTR